jgi:hypothetical protein
MGAKPKMTTKIVDLDAFGQTFIAVSVYEGGKHVQTGGGQIFALARTLNKQRIQSTLLYMRVADATAGWVWMDGGGSLPPVDTWQEAVEQAKAQGWLVYSLQADTLPRHPPEESST